MVESLPSAFLFDNASTADGASAALERVASESLFLSAPSQAAADLGGGVLDRTVVLRLDELVSDDKGEVVISVGASLRTLILEGNAEVTGQGTLPVVGDGLSEITGGVGYLTFATGITVYFPSDLEVVLSMPAT